MLLGEGVAGVAGGSAIDGGVSGLLRDMGRDACPSQIGDEIGAVVALVGTQREAAGGAGGTAVDPVECCAPFGVAVGPGQPGLDGRVGYVVEILERRSPSVVSWP